MDGLSLTGFGWPENSPCRPIIVYDCDREPCPLPVKTMELQRGFLPAGPSYGLAGDPHGFGIVRRDLETIARAAMPAGRARKALERDLGALKLYAFPRLLIIGGVAAILGHRYEANVSPEKVMDMLREHGTNYRTPVLFSPTVEAAASLLCSLAHDRATATGGHKVSTSFWG